MNITGNDLINLGWKSGKSLGVALKKANSLSLTKEEILSLPEFKNPSKEIEKEFPREIPNSLSIALHPDSPTTSDNYDAVLRQMQELLKMPRVLRGAVMPDACPAGHEKANITVGGAIEVDNAIIPSAHSADVCCSMYATFFTSKMDVKNMMQSLKTSTRFGVGGRSKSGWVHHDILNDMSIFKTNTFLKGLEDFAYSHMADQGDGNHFAYLGKILVTQDFINHLSTNEYESESINFKDFLNQEVYVLVTHHGSRGLGAQLYKKGLKEAEKQTNSLCKNVPNTAAFIDYNTQEGKDYWDALQYIKDWTKANHESIHERFVTKIKGLKIESMWNEHNFVWKRGNSFFHGKGATPAWKDEMGRRKLGLIPLNMGREILIVLGNDNDKYLSFAPHGAGRNLSRTAISKNFKDESGNIDEQKVIDSINEQTKGLEIIWYSGKPDISESPIAYKCATRVKEEIKEFELATVIMEIQPLGAIMAGESTPVWKKNKR